MRTRRIVASVLVLMTVVIAAGCGSRSPTGPRGGETPPAPAPAAVRVSLRANPIEVHQETVAEAQALDQYGAPIVAGTAAYTSSADSVAVVGPTTGAIFAIGPGTTQITATIAGKSDRQTLTVFKAPIRINEVEPNGDGPGGWVELFNPTASSVDMSGWVLTASDVYQEFIFPAGATIAAGGYLVVDESSFPAGLEAADVVHLFSHFGVQVDQFGWTEGPATTYGRCPDGTGPFVVTASPTRGSANSCP